MIYFLSFIYYNKERGKNPSLSRGRIIKTNATYGNHLTLLQILPQFRHMFRSNNNDNIWLWKKSDLLDNRHYDRMCNIDIIAPEQIVSNTFTEDENGDKIFKEGILS